MQSQMPWAESHQSWMQKPWSLSCAQHMMDETPIGYRLGKQQALCISLEKFITMGMTERADAHEPVVAEANEEIHKQVWETGVLARAGHAHVSLHVINCIIAQQEDPILKTLIKLIYNWKVQDLKHLLGDGINTEEGEAILQERKKLMLYTGDLYHHHPLAGELEEVFQLMVPMTHWVPTKNGCHQVAGHQGQQQTLYLLLNWFWWPGMAMQIQKAISSCEWCIQHEGTHAKV